MRITEQLLRLGEIWSQTDGRSLARLSTIVVNDGAFFERIANPDKGCSSRTIETFLSFFRDGASWPDGRIPQEAVDVLDNFANIATRGLAADEAAEQGGDNANAGALSPEQSGDSFPSVSEQDAA